VITDDDPVVEEEMEVFTISKSGRKKKFTKTVDAPVIPVTEL